NWGSTNNNGPFQILLSQAATAGAGLEVGPLTFGGQNRTLTLTGANTGANSLDGALGDSGAGTLSVAKTGAETWNLTGTNLYTGTTTVSAGKLSVRPSAIPANNSVTVTGGEYSMSGASGAYKVGSLSISGSGLASMGTGNDKVLVTTALNLSGNGRLDINDDRAIINYTGASPASAIRAALIAGRGPAGFGNAT